MNKAEIYQKDSTNLRISNDIRMILEDDCYHFGYTKNTKPNLSGFCNKLIDELTEYREDLHKSFLDYNNNDVNLTQKIESNLYNVYLKKYSLESDVSTNIQIRFNSVYHNTFNDIHDRLLVKYDMNFSSFIKTLLNEYSIKPIYQREQLFLYKEMKIIKKAMQSEGVISLYMDKEKLIIVPLGIEINPIKNTGCLIAVGEDKENEYVIPLCHITRICDLERTCELTAHDYLSAFNYYEASLIEEGEN